MSLSLDWTTNPYVAAFFAVVDSAGVDGTVWVVDRLAMFDGMRVKYGDKWNEELNMMGGLQQVKEDPKLWFYKTDRPDARMVAQGGWFSFSNRIDCDHRDIIGTALQKSIERRWHAKIIINKELKVHFLMQMVRMNITPYTLFPGIEGLGRAVALNARILEQTTYVKAFDAASSKFDIGYVGERKKAKVGE